MVRDCGAGRRAELIAAVLPPRAAPPPTPRSTGAVLAIRVLTASVLAEVKRSQRSIDAGAVLRAVNVHSDTHDSPAMTGRDRPARVGNAGHRGVGGREPNPSHASMSSAGAQPEDTVVGPHRHNARMVGPPPAKRSSNVKTRVDGALPCFVRDVMRRSGLGIDPFMTARTRAARQPSGRWPLPTEDRRPSSDIRADRAADALVGDATRVRTAPRPSLAKPQAGKAAGLSGHARRRQGTPFVPLNRTVNRSRCAGGLRRQAGAGEGVRLAGRRLRQHG